MKGDRGRGFPPLGARGPSGRRARWRPVRSPRSPQPRDVARTMRVLLAAALAVVLALVGLSRIPQQEEPPAVEEWTADATGDPGTHEPGNIGVPTTRAAPLGSGGGQPTSTTSPGAQRSSVASEPEESLRKDATPQRVEDANSDASPPADAIPQRSETAGPPVSYTDQPDDAHGPVTHAALSRPAFDILRVDWARRRPSTSTGAVTPLRSPSPAPPGKMGPTFPMASSRLTSLGRSASSTTSSHQGRPPSPMPSAGR
jgi:hypothetical protein